MRAVNWRRARGRAERRAGAEPRWARVGAALVWGMVLLGTRAGPADLQARDALHGPRVFALEPALGLGLRGTFGFGEGLVTLSDPLRLELERIDERGAAAGALTLALEETRVRETHLERSWLGGAGLHVQERVWIGEGDTFMAELLFANRGPEALELELHASGGVTTRPDRSSSQQRRIELPAEHLVDPALLRMPVPPAGALELDGRAFALAPAGRGARAAVLFSAPPSGQGSQDLVVELPSTRPAAATLHVLAALATPLGEGGGTPAFLVALLDDGSREVLPWPAAGSLPDGLQPGRPTTLQVAAPAGGRARVEWRAAAVAGIEAPLLLCSYRPPPGRFAHALALRHAGGPEHPALLAVTLEIPPPEGPLPVLVGEATLGGMPVPFALAATGALPVVTEAGTRVLARRLALAPGERAAVVAALVSGVRSFQAALMAMSWAEDEPREGALLARHVAAREGWRAAHLPRFGCEDPELERTWQRAVALLLRDRRSLSLPEFSLPVLYEGTCCSSHTRVAPLAATLALGDLRWLVHDDTAQGTLRALMMLQRESGLVVPVSPERFWASEPHALAAAALGVYAVSGSEQLLGEVLPSLERDLEARLARSIPAAGPARTLLEASARALVQGFGVLGEPERARAIAELASELGPREPLPDYVAAARELLAAREPSGCGAPPSRGELEGVIGELVGLRPALDGSLQIHPRAQDLAPFRLTHVLHRGRRVDLTWSPPGRPRPSGGDEAPEGFTVSVDDRTVHRSARLEAVRVP